MTLAESTNFIYVNYKYNIINFTSGSVVSVTKLTLKEDPDSADIRTKLCPTDGKNLTHHLKDRVSWLL